jgi:hypothetical protein
VGPQRLNSLLKNSLQNGVFQQTLKPPSETAVLIAELKRCATQNPVISPVILGG